MKSSGDPIRVLFVEDDADVASVVMRGLAPMGIVTRHARDLATGEQLLRQERFHALILDLTLPDGDGLDLAVRLRTAGNEIPVLMLTARDTVSDRLTGFDRGADDYLGKPFDVNELAARLRVIVRRAQKGERHLVRYADLELDIVTRTARRSGLTATLSDREVELLACMMRRPEKALTRDYLLEEVWGDEIDESSNLVNVYINLLRNKLESPNHSPLIRTVRGIGYMLSAEERPETI